MGRKVLIILVLTASYLSCRCRRTVALVQATRLWSMRMIIITIIAFICIAPYIRNNNHFQGYLYYKLLNNVYKYLCIMLKHIIIK